MTNPDLKIEQINRTYYAALQQVTKPSFNNAVRTHLYILEDIAHSHFVKKETEINLSWDFKLFVDWYPFHACRDEFFILEHRTYALIVRRSATHISHFGFIIYFIIDTAQV